MHLWTRAEDLWQRRSALVATLPFAKLPHPKPAEVAARERILDWAAGYCSDPDWFIQKAVADWLCDLSKHDAARAAAFLAEHGPYLRRFARIDAARYLSLG